MHPCLVVRHGKAADTAPSGRDADRALTGPGIEEMERIAVALAATTPPLELVLASPFRRARQTADIVARALDDVPVHEAPALASGAAPEAMMEALTGYCEESGGGIALVGHEPDLGHFISYALAASTRSFHQLRKGGACLLELPAMPRAGTATLDWALDPVQLRALAPGGRP